MAPLLWLAVVSVAVTAASASCPTEEWLLDRGNCYWKSPFTIDWESGEMACYFEFPGSHLVSIHDDMENAFVFEHVSNWTWLGFITSDGPWHWSDGSPANWTNWCDGQPTDYFEGYAILFPEENGCWWTGNNYRYAPVVCKVPEQD